MRFYRHKIPEMLGSADYATLRDIYNKLKNGEQK